MDIQVSENENEEQELIDDGSVVVDEVLIQPTTMMENDVIGTFSFLLLVLYSYNV